MAIEFHCDHCGKLVRTDSGHAGKRGRCPACHQSVYIPSPSAEIDPLELAPLDESGERAQERLEQETRELTHELLHETESPPDRGRPRAAAGPPAPPRLDIQELLVCYARYMADGKLADAEEVAAEIRSDMSRAAEIIQRLTMDEIPPAGLDDVPRPVLIGFFKQLREQS